MLDKRIMLFRHNRLPILILQIVIHNVYIYMKLLILHNLNLRNSFIEHWLYTKSDQHFACSRAFLLDGKWVTCFLKVDTKSLENDTLAFLYLNDLLSVIAYHPQYHLHNNDEICRICLKLL